MNFVPVMELVWKVFVQNESTLSSFEVTYSYFVWSYWPQAPALEISTPGPLLQEGGWKGVRSPGSYGLPGV